MSRVNRHPGISPSQLAADVGPKASNASADLRSLEASGFIVRVADPQDRRADQVRPY